MGCISRVCRRRRIPVLYIAHLWHATGHTMYSKYARSGTEKWCQPYHLLLRYVMTLLCAKQQNFRQVQIENICRQQIKNGWVGGIFPWWGCNSLPDNHEFWQPWKWKLLKKLWEKKKILLINIFFFSHNVF